MPRRRASWSIRSSKGLSKLTATRTGSGGSGPTETGTWIRRLFPRDDHCPIRADTSVVGDGTSSPSSRRASIAVCRASEACCAISPRVVATDATSGKSGDNKDHAWAASSHSATIGYSNISTPSSFNVEAATPSRPACKFGAMCQWECRRCGLQQRPYGRFGGRCGAIPFRRARRSLRAATAASPHGPSCAMPGLTMPRRCQCASLGVAPPHHRNIVHP